VASGKKIRSYKAKDLIFKDEVEKTVSGFYWSRDDGSVNNKNNTFTIKKINGEKLIFNFKNGDLVEGKIPSKEEASSFRNNNYNTEHSQNIESSNKKNNSFCLSITIVIYSLILLILR
jgi:hypothetical protein